MATFRPRVPHRSGHAILKEFSASLESLDDGWRFVPIEVQLQTDGCSCGLWVLLVSRAFVAYVDSSQFGTKSFGTFLVGWLAELQPQPVANLLAVGGRGQQRTAAVEGNLTFIREERSQLRALLIQAARDGTLAYANGSLLEDFLEGTNTAATPAELEELNEEDE